MVLLAGLNALSDSLGSGLLGQVDLGTVTVLDNNLLAFFNNGVLLLICCLESLHHFTLSAQYAADILPLDMLLAWRALKEA